MKNSNRAGSDRKQSLMQWMDKQEDDASQLVRAVRYMFRLLLITIRQFNSNELSLRSGALTYTILLSLVPMIAMSTAVVKGMGGGDQLREAAYGYLDTLDSSKTSPPSLPATENQLEETPTSNIEAEPENLTGHLRSAVDQLFDYVDNTNFATLGTFGVVGILLSVLLVLSHIESAMNAIWKVSAGRSPLRKLADYLTLLILFPISINVAFAASAVLTNPALSTQLDIFVPFSWIQALLLKAVPVFFIALSFYAMYIFFPNTKVKTLPAVVGATLAAILWFGVQNIYISLQVGVANYNAIYGSFATFPLFIVWIYLCWMFILLGAQVAFALQNAHTFRLLPVESAPSLKLSAAFDIMDQVYNSFESEIRVTNSTLVANLSTYPKPLLEDVSELLVDAGIIHISETDNRFLPKLPQKNFKPYDLVKTILGEETPDTSGGHRSLAAINSVKEASH